MKFKILMNQNSPSSANTYKVIPFWDSGYAIIINQGTEQYCYNCEYHMIVYNEEESDTEKGNDIIVELITEEKDESKNLNNLYPILDALEMDSKSGTFLPATGAPCWIRALPMTRPSSTS